MRGRSGKGHHRAGGEAGANQAARQPGNQTRDARLDSAYPRADCNERALWLHVRNMGPCDEEGGSQDSRQAGRRKRVPRLDTTITTREAYVNRTSRFSRVRQPQPLLSLVSAVTGWYLSQYLRNLRVYSRLLPPMSELEVRSVRA